MDIKTTNNFGFLRLLFASLVILSHSAELIDGNPSREILHSIFGTTTLGSLAVTGFFLISGYLITASLINSRTIQSYFTKRILRIYPGFIVASLISIFIFAPLSGGWVLIQNFSIADWLKIPFKMAILTQPWVEGAFATVKNQALNASMWTIKYEFLCYVSILVLVLSSLKKRTMISVFVVSLAVYLYTVFANHDWVMTKPFDLSVHFYSKFLLAFSAGSLYYLYREQIVWHKYGSQFAFVLLVLSMCYERTAHLGLVVFGGYLLFKFALDYKNTFLSQIGTRTDISYGVYLYAFPFQNLMIQYNGGISPNLLSFYTLIYTFIIGYLSWILVEKPFMDMKGKLARASALNTGTKSVT